MNTIHYSRVREKLSLQEHNTTYFTPQASLVPYSEKNCVITFCDFVLEQTFHGINFAICVLVLCICIVMLSNLRDKLLRICSNCKKTRNINLTKISRYMVSNVPNALHTAQSSLIINISYCNMTRLPDDPKRNRS